MALKLTASDGVKVYNVTSGKTLPQWLSEEKKKSLKKNDEYMRRLELIQDFSFPAACQRIKVTPDQQYIFATGYHPPMLKVYDLANLSLKFDRHMDAEVVDFQILTEEYSKAAFLCNDRTICLHARFGSYYKTRVPKFGRDLAYVPFAAELLVTGSFSEVYRLSLEEGRFMQPLASRSPAINASGVSPVHGLVGCAGEGGGLECFDLRQRASAGFLDAASACGAAGEDLTALRFDDTGMYVAVGTRTGLVGLFDLRSQKPMIVKDHMYGSRIVDIKFHSCQGDSGGLGGRHVVSSDTHIVKIWDMSSGQNYTSIEPSEGDINDVCVWPHSGLIMLACDSPKLHGYFIPSLGPAPRWCHFLEGLTEELEETAPAVYDDYRFVTKADLVKLGLDHLMGTAMLRAYMHGFFIDNRLYEKAKVLTDPFAYETYRHQRVQKKLEEERQSRISMVKKLPKVNAKVAAKLLAQEAEAVDAAATTTEPGDADGAVTRRRGELVANPLADDRFKAMFEEEDFVVDEASAEYRLLHPNVGKDGRSAAADRNLVSEHFEQVSEDDEASSSGHDSDASLDEMGEAPAEMRRQRRQAEKDKEKKQVARSLGKGAGTRLDSVASGRVQKPAVPAMYAPRDSAALEAFRRGESTAVAAAQTLAERAASLPADVSRRVGGSREVAFVPAGSRQFGTGNRGRGRGGRGRGSEEGAEGPGEGQESRDKYAGGGARGAASRGGRGGGRGGSRGGGRGRGGGGRGRGGGGEGGRRGGRRGGRGRGRG